MPSTAADLGVLLSRAARAQRTLAASMLAPLGLHPGQDELLRCLWRRDGQSQSSLVDQLGVEAPTVTKMVHRLEASGFVQRRPHPSDRRSIQVWLTPAGRDLKPAVQRVRTRLERRLTDGLGPRQQASLRTLLQRLADDPDAG
jgi:MarR family transcriptional regulator, organic hydroperoxide resistance regulator